MVKKSKRKNCKERKEEFDKETEDYFKTINKPPVLCIPVSTNHQSSQICSSPENSTSQLTLPLANATILWIYENYELFDLFRLTFVANSDEDTEKDGVKALTKCCSPVDIHVSYRPVSTGVIRDIKTFLEEKKGHTERIPFQLSFTQPVLFIQEKNLIITGLSSICRFIIKFAQMKSKAETTSRVEIQNSNFQRLLGFREICLQACAEVSVWTKFCEVDVFSGLASLNNHRAKTDSSEAPSIEQMTKELFRFEYHLRMPVRIHNIMKETCLKAKEMRKTENNINTTTVMLDHDFAEGPYLLLSDLILLPALHICQIVFGPESLEEKVPHVYKWICKMSVLFPKVAKNFHLASSSPITLLTRTDKVLLQPPDDVPEESLYKSDKTRYNPTSRAFTRQYDVDQALEFFNRTTIQAFDVTDVSTFLNWDEIPTLVHPDGGQMPEIRRERKCQQLSCMVVEVMKIVEEKKVGNSTRLPLRIVDFCSGGGHVGIMLAWFLPDCQIILVENKEESLRRGWERVERLGLTNVLFYQCNLDYFDSPFEIGVSLHACGSSTDLVLAKCLSTGASFVCSPCCYGNIRNNHMLHYPKSCEFRERSGGISPKHYFTLAHASDQTQTDGKNEKTEQGKLCMRLIDTDRAIHAQENGYRVVLKRMFPESASPKNHILVGISSSSNPS